MTNNYFGVPIDITAVPVTNGFFSVTLDFGSGVFTGEPLWLGLSVRPHGNGAYTQLLPLQELTPTPYAIFAEAASNLAGPLPSTGFAGTYNSPVALINGGDMF